MIIRFCLHPKIVLLVEWILILGGLILFLAFQIEPLPAVYLAISVPKSILCPITILLQRYLALFIVLSVGYSIALKVVVVGMGMGIGVARWRF